VENRDWEENTARPVPAAHFTRYFPRKGAKARRTQREEGKKQGGAGQAVGVGVNK